VRVQPPRAVADLAPLHDALAPGRLAVAAVVALVASAVFAIRLARHVRAGTSPGAAVLVAPFLVVFLAIQIFGKAAVDPVKNLHGLTAAIARLAPGPGPVPLYVPAGAPTDSILGILDFDLGRRPLRLSMPGEVAAFFASHPGGALALSVEAARRLPPGLRAHLDLVYDETGRRASPWAVAEWRP
ncbi:MAG TPA: hypothetical protein VIH93_15880, partial [Thermoanaerobaculia bacterium]